MNRPIKEKLKHERASKFLFGIFIAALILGIHTIIFHEQILLNIGNFLIIQDDLEPADLIHVIAGLNHRADYAIHMYKLGYGKRIFFTGGWCPSHNHYHGEFSKKRALDQGVPLEAAVADDSCVTSTYSEIVRLKKFIEETYSPIHSVLVVSDPHHMRRARWAYRKVLGKDFNLVMSPVPFGHSPYRQRWWEEEGSKRLVKDEYLKWGYYIARYELSWGFLKDWLASLDRD
jgi:uncharacterized SAM-binding protein YcdF (DUF218 family)